MKLISSALGQNVTVVKGVVLDEHDRPLPAVIVSRMSDRKTLGTSEINGLFQVNAIVTDSLSFSHVGYKQVTLAVNSVASKISTTIRMRQIDNVMDEVLINTGYYTIPKERATGAFSHIDNELLNRTNGTSILDRLEGITNSVLFDRRNLEGENVNGRPEIRVRGLNTIDSDSSPLIVLDNFPYDGDISTINPNDVESITVLKDAAAASIWGAKAGNGVIVINTKRGTYNKPTAISFITNYTFGKKPNLFYNQKYLPSSTVMTIQKELFERGTYLEQNQTRIPAYVELLIAKRDDKLTQQEFTIQEDLLARTDLREQWSKHLYRPNFTGQYSLGISGGTSKHRYSFNTGYDKNCASIVGNEDSRINLSFQNAFKIGNNLELNSGVWYTSQYAATNGIGYSSALNTDIYMPLQDELGNPSYLTKTYRLRYQKNAPTIGLLDWLYRPIEEVRLTDNENRKMEWRINTGINYRLPLDIQIQAFYQYTQGTGKEQTYYDKDSYFVRNLVNRFTQSNGNRVIPYGGIMEYEQPAEHKTHSGRLQINYKRTIASMHEMTALAGTEIRQTVFQTIPGMTLYNFNPETWSADFNVDYKTLNPTRPTGNSRIPSKTLSPTKNNGRNLSYYGNGSYSYDNRYVWSGSIRWDGSNLLGVKSNQRGTVLWSSGVSWNIGNELFFKNEVMEQLRFRITYGSAGNIDKSQSHYPTIAYALDEITGLPVANLNHPGNPALKWEQVNTLNFGIDVGLWGNRITLALDLYRKKAKDLLGNRVLDPSTGVTSAFKLNYAGMETQGFDIQLSSKNIKGVFNWDTDLLLNYTTNKITNFKNIPITNIAEYINNPPPMNGKSLDNIYAYRWNGLNSMTGYPIVYIDDKETTDYIAYINQLAFDDLIEVGSTVPKLFSSLRNTWSWKGWQLSTLLSFKSGFVFRRSSIGSGQEYGSTPYYHMDYFKRWTQSGDEHFTNVPAWSKTTSSSTGWTLYRDSEALITNGASIRMQDIQASYLLPLKWGQAKMLKADLKIFLGIRNVGILWRANKQAIDPDFPKASYPLPRFMNVGVNLNF
ncbi:SusC/RagA family TonB-linked outer membrane protein [Sphingobacterium sp. JUb56]|uniref:SusC/RagA family TonB-linked outer membrane protein n=1 Tax=Sphingobacterium sp. JUb56 TaxID=2587145 RepID=UPI0016192FE5|nr:SusC/RagA family TonB-linked outer membrane protein [Sphingobacterium sp. JUb56]MBB2953808.1 TonB-linked SusC/RagA family outer membrane protein [Sphingobacterium sp. JUb56]